MSKIRGDLSDNKGYQKLRRSPTKFWIEQTLGVIITLYTVFYLRTSQAADRKCEIWLADHAFYRVFRNRRNTIPAKRVGGGFYKGNPMQRLQAG